MAGTAFASFRARIIANTARHAAASLVRTLAITGATLCASVLGMGTPAFADVKAAPTASTLAPADRYFGRLEMSILGIRNAIADLSRISNDAGAGDAKIVLRKLTFVENALLDLKAQFPKDSWVPQLGLDLAAAFGKLKNSDAAINENATIDWVVADYPATPQAQAARQLGTTTVVRVRPSVDDLVPIELALTFARH